MSSPVATHSGDTGSPAPEGHGSDSIARLDRLVGRSVPLMLLALLAGLWAFAPAHRIPDAAIVAALCVYALSKLVVAAAGVWRHWAAWPALVAEAAAMLAVVAIVWTRARDPLYLLPVAALLLAAGLRRARAARTAIGDE
jgi:hypothetical protein